MDDFIKGLRSVSEFLIAVVAFAAWWEARHARKTAKEVKKVVVHVDQVVNEVWANGTNGSLNK